MAEENKGASIFDFISGMSDKKKAWDKWSETDQKRFSPYITNRWLSMKMELTELVNEIQKYSITILRPQETYKLYHDKLPATKIFAKYIKGKTADKYNSGLISQIAEHYHISKSEATDYAELLDETQCTRLLSLYGYTEKEIKAMTKGVRK